MLVKGGGLYLGRGSEVRGGCSRTHSEVDARCLRPGQVVFSREYFLTDLASG